MYGKYLEKSKLSGTWITETGDKSSKNDSQYISYSLAKQITEHIRSLASSIGRAFDS
ncbi:unnamed protein product [Debaryomyces tyrocola]|nr:unnamed protein product [Debaryomyces tyrocola]